MAGRGLRWKGCHGNLIELDNFSNLIWLSKKRIYTWWQSFNNWAYAIVWCFCDGEWNNVEQNVKYYALQRSPLGGEQQKCKSPVRGWQSNFMTSKNSSMQGMADTGSVCGWELHSATVCNVTDCRVARPTMQTVWTTGEPGPTAMMRRK